MDPSDLTPPKKLLVATDLSERSDNAVRRAVLIASELGASLEILHVLDDAMPANVVDEYETAARDSIGKLLATTSQSASAKPAITLKRGSGYREILEHAKQNGIDLIIIGVTRHTLAALFAGTTAERIIRIGETPVLMVKDPATGPYERVLIAMDNSPSAERALYCALGVAPTATFCLAHVAHVPFKGLLGQSAHDDIRAERDREFTEKLTGQISAAAARLGIAEPEAKVTIEEGDVAHVVRTKTKSFAPDLLAMGTHGRAALRHALVGSLAQKLLADPPVDILIAKG